MRNADFRQDQQLTNWRQRVTDNLKGMIQHIGASNKYRELILPNSSPHVIEHQDELRDAAEICLDELVQIPPGEGEWAWIDDRNVSSYEKCNEVPIITTFGILEELCRGGHITREDFYA